LRIALSGPPGSGKTTIARRSADLLKSLGCRPLGFYTPEVRESGRRTGFLVEDLETGETVWLARRGLPSKYRVGSYGIYEEAGKFLCNILDRTVEAEIIVIDEIGPMELVFPCVRTRLSRLLSHEEQSFLIVYHRRLREKYPGLHRLITGKAIVFWVSVESRSKVWADVKRRIEEFCSARRGGSNGSE